MRKGCENQRRKRRSSDRDVRILTVYLFIIPVRNVIERCRCLAPWQRGSRHLVVGETRRDQARRRETSRDEMRARAPVFFTLISLICFIRFVNYMRNNSTWRSRPDNIAPSDLAEGGAQVWPPKSGYLHEYSRHFTPVSGSSYSRY